MHRTPPGFAMMLLAGSAVLLSTAALAASGDKEVLEAVARQCDSCHGANATEQANAPLLDGMQRAYIEEQLENFRNGARGSDASDSTALRMTEQAQALTDSQVRDLARVYARRKLVRSAATVAGDPVRGGPLFEEHCAGCHASSMGRRFTGSPVITHLPGPYILSQLQAFASDRRGFDEEGEHKLKMAEVAKRFSPEEMHDITAYIKAELN